MDKEKEAKLRKMLDSLGIEFKEFIDIVITKAS